MSKLNLDSEVELFGFAITPDGLEIIAGRFYVCPDCGDGHVTNHGGGVYMCGNCEYQH